MKHVVSLTALSNLGAPLPDLVEEFSDAGFAGISVAPGILTNLTSSDMRNFAAIVAERDTVVALHGEFTTSVKDLAGLAQIIGPRLATVTFDPDLGWTSAGFLFLMERMVPFLSELDHVARTHGFKFGMEDFPETPFALKMYQDSLSSLLESDHFGVLIDIGHFNLSANKYGYFKGITPEEHLAQLPLRLLEVHLSDNDGKEDQHLPPGMGVIDYGSVARGLRDTAFNGLSTIEIEPRRDCPVAEAKQDILKSLSYWKQVCEQQGA